MCYVLFFPTVWWKGKQVKKMVAGGPEPQYPDCVEGILTNCIWCNVWIRLCCRPHHQLNISTLKRSVKNIGWLIDQWWLLLGLHKVIYLSTYKTGLHNEIQVCKLYLLHKLQNIYIVINVHTRSASSESVSELWCEQQQQDGDDNVVDISHKKYSGQRFPDVEFFMWRCPHYHHRVRQLDLRCCGGDISFSIGRSSRWGWMVELLLIQNKCFLLQWWWQYFRHPRDGFVNLKELPAVASSCTSVAIAKAQKSEYTDFIHTSTWYKIYFKSTGPGRQLSRKEVSQSSALAAWAPLQHGDLEKTGQRHD